MQRRRLRSDDQMNHPSQEELACGLEAEWTELFKLAHKQAKRDTDLIDAIVVLTVEIEALLDVQPYERRVIAEANELTAAGRAKASLVKLHPTIYTRATLPATLETSG
jgi:predicted ATPase